MTLRLLTVILTVILTVSALTLMAVTIAHSTCAQPPALPQPDRDGNDFSNETPVKGTAPHPLMSGSFWQVVSSKLNCRSHAGLNYDVVRQFKQGDRLQADVGRGGADEVMLNFKEATGQPWMRVRNARGQNLNCYVRANRAYIQPDRGQ